MTKAKKELEGQLQNLRNTFFVGIAACYLIADERSLPLMTTHPFDKVAERLSEAKNRKFEVLELQKFLLRAMLKEPFELVKDYCNSTNQFNVFAAQSWYQFARVLRNNISHNMRFDFTQGNIGKILPVTWNGKTIDASLQDKELTFTLMDPKDVIALVAEMEEFVRKTLA